jgi:adenylyl-sulfate kinase
MRRRGFTVWFTGLSGAGKSTITAELVKEFEKRGVGHEVLDGDVVRTHLSKGLGFSKEDRDINIRRIGWVASTLTKHGVGVVCAAISPYRSVRDEVRASVAQHGTFLEVFAKCPIPVLSDRDPKGLYKKALAGQLPNFTGVSDPYEEPLHPEVVCETDKESVTESAGKILGRLEQLGLIPPAGGKIQDYSPEQEAKLRKRLEDMGYL